MRARGVQRSEQFEIQEEKKPINDRICHWNHHQSFHRHHRGVSGGDSFGFVSYCDRSLVAWIRLKPLTKIIAARERRGRKKKSINEMNIQAK
jgi:hypothetical protein